MKIIYVSQFFFPENVAASFRVFETCKVWVEEGEEVTVLTGVPNYPLGKIFKGYKNKLLYEENIEGIKVKRSKVLVLPNKNYIYQALNTLGFLFFGLINVIFNKKKIGKNDVVIGTSGQILTPLIALFYSKLLKIPFVLELRDISFIQMLALGKSKKSFSFRILKFIELYLCKKSRKIIVVTKGFKEKLISYGVEEDKIEVIPNGVFLEKTNKKFISDINNKIRVSFFGNFGKSQDVLGALKFLENFSEDINVLLIGAGKELPLIKSYMEGNKNLEVSYLESMPQEELEKYYETSDLCLVCLINNNLFKNTIPSKIFQISGRGKVPLYFGPKCEGSDILKKTDSGFVLYNDNLKLAEEKMKEILKSVKLDKELLVQKGENGYLNIKTNFERRNLSLKYLRCLEEVQEMKGRKNEVKKPIRI